jgi:hypothetical protein
MVRARALSIGLVVCAAATLAGQRGQDDPETVIRSLVQALYANDVRSYEALTLPHPLRSRLTSGGSVNENGLRELREDPEGLQIRQIRPFMLQGKPVTLGTNARYAVGTTALYRVAHHRQPMVVALTRRPEGWKVDLRWWIAMTDLMSGKLPPQDSPEVAIRSLLASMLRLDRARAQRYITDAKGIDLLFDGAPSQREPSGVLDASVGEMPLVEVGPGEFFPTPTGRIVEGAQAPDRKLIVGWFGPVEMPFVLHRVGTGWRVEPEPYFALMNR